MDLLAKLSADYLLPEDFYSMRKLLHYNAKQKQRVDFTDIVTVPLTVPLAAVGAFSYLGRGILAAGVDLLDGKGRRAGKILLKNGMDALLCVALFVSLIFYSVFGLCGYGKYIYQSYEPESQINRDSQIDENQQVRSLETRLERARVALSRALSLSGTGVARPSEETLIKQILEEQSNKNKELEEENKELKTKIGKMRVKFCEMRQKVLIDYSAKGIKEPVPDFSASLYGSFSAPRMDPQPSDGYLQTAWNIIKNAVIAVTEKMTPEADISFFIYFIDRGAPWKEERYGVYIKQLKDFLNLGALATPTDPSKPFLNNLYCSLNALKNTIYPRDDYHQFLHSIREILRNCIKVPLFDIALFCQNWFTRPQILSNLKEIVFYLGDAGRKAIGKNELKDALIGKPLSEQVEMTFKALETTPGELLAPTIHLLCGKVWKLTTHFDALAHTNMPWQWCQETFECREKRKTLIRFRTGVPVCKAKESDPRDRVINDRTIVPEYWAFLKNLKKNNQKLVVFLHLNPSFLVRNGESFDAETSSNPLKYLKVNEADWSRVMLDLPRHFQDNVRVCLLPFDGKWKQEDQFTKSGRTNEFTAWLLKKMQSQDPKNPFILPKEVMPLLPVVFEAVQKRYFTTPILTKERKDAFLGFLYTYLQEAISLQFNADYVQDNCTDGIDRTAEIMGSNLAIRLAELGKLQDKEMQENYLGTVLGPALAIWKRPILEERREVFMATLRHAETLKKEQFGLEINGWKFVDVSLK